MIQLQYLLLKYIQYQNYETRDEYTTRRKRFVREGEHPDIAAIQSQSKEKTLSLIT